MGFAWRLRPLDHDDNLNPSIPHQRRLAGAFDAEHRKQFHFSFDKDHELVNLRAVVESKPAQVEALLLPRAPSPDPAAARVGSSQVFMEGREQEAAIYDRAKLLAGHRMEGPAIVTEMDSTTLVLADCFAEVHETGVILIRPKPMPKEKDGNGQGRGQQQQQQLKRADKEAARPVPEFLAEANKKIVASIKGGWKPTCHHHHHHHPCTHALTSSSHACIVDRLAGCGVRGAALRALLRPRDDRPRALLRLHLRASPLRGALVCGKGLSTSTPCAPFS